MTHTSVPDCQAGFIGGAGEAGGFGFRVAICADLQVVESPSCSNNRGKVNVFPVSGSNDELVGTEDQQFFGSAVDACGTKVAVGAQGTTVVGFSLVGSVTVYDSGSSMVINIPSPSDNPVSDHRFGLSVALCASYYRRAFSLLCFSMFSIFRVGPSIGSVIKIRWANEMTHCDVHVLA